MNPPLGPPLAHRCPRGPTVRRLREPDPGSRWAPRTIEPGKRGGFQVDDGANSLRRQGDDPHRISRATSVLVFPAHHPMLRYHGAFSANHKLRALIASCPETRPAAIFIIRGARTAGSWSGRQAF